MATEVLNSPALKIAVSETERQQANNLLQQHQIPTSDLDDDKLL